MPISLLEMFLRLATAVLLGGGVGLERELHEEPAGLRTHFLVALASATFMLVSSQFVFHGHYADNGIIRADVGRIASNVVVGIGFLGAGAILRTGFRVKGLTTAASLWMVAAIGLAAGGGMYLLAVSTTAMALFALIGLRLFERRFRNTVKLRVRLEVAGKSLDRGRLRQALEPIGAKVDAIDYERDRVASQERLRLDLRLPRPDLEEAMIGILENLPSVRKIRVRRPLP